METTAVTCAHHSRLQREILRIYLRTNKIMMVSLTLTAPNLRFLPFFPSPPPLSSLPSCVPFLTHYLLVSFPSPPVFLFPCPFLDLSLTVSHHFCLPVSLHLSLCLCSPWLCLLVSAPQSQVAMPSDGSCPPGPWSRPAQTCPACPDLLGLTCHPL